jgi:hypothetical protein
VGAFDTDSLTLVPTNNEQNRTKTNGVGFASKGLRAPRGERGGGGGGMGGEGWVWRPTSTAAYSSAAEEPVEVPAAVRGGRDDVQVAWLNRVCHRERGWVAWGGRCSSSFPCVWKLRLAVRDVLRCDGDGWVGCVGKEKRF